MTKLDFSHLKNVIFTTIASLATVLTIIIFLHTYGPAIEGSLFPIVSDFKIEAIMRESDSTILIRGTMIKARDDCPFQGITAYVNDPKLPEIIRLASVDFIETNNIIVARVKGLQSWGPWRVETLVSNKGYDLTIVIYHTCHMFYSVPTVLIQTKLP